VQIAQEHFMRHIALVTLIACGFAWLGTIPAGAVGTRHPFCLQGDEYPGLSACTFDTYEQCQATASGRKVYCIALAGRTTPTPIAIAIGRFRRIIIRFRQATIPDDITDLQQAWRAQRANVS
jgi:hypothetical protein